MELQIKKRRAVIVWVYSLRHLKTLKRFGTLQYISKKMKYVVIYMDEETVDAAEDKLSRLHFVRQVERSYRPDVEMNFADKIGKRNPIMEEEGFEVEEVKTEIQLVDTM